MDAPDVGNRPGDADYSLTAAHRCLPWIRPITLDAGDVYRIEVEALDWGSFSLSVEELFNDQVVSSIFYADVPISAQTLGGLTLQSGSTTTAPRTTGEPDCGGAVTTSASQARAAMVTLGTGLQGSPTFQLGALISKELSDRRLLAVRVQPLNEEPGVAFNPGVVPRQTPAAVSQPPSRDALLVQNVLQMAIERPGYRPQSANVTHVPGSLGTIMFQDRWFCGLPAELRGSVLEVARRLAGPPVSPAASSPPAQSQPVAASGSPRIKDFQVLQFRLGMTASDAKRVYPGFNIQDPKPGKHGYTHHLGGGAIEGWSVTALFSPKERGSRLYSLVMGQTRNIDTAALFGSLEEKYGKPTCRVYNRNLNDGEICWGACRPGARAMADVTPPRICLTPDTKGVDRQQVFPSRGDYFHVSVFGNSVTATLIDAAILEQVEAANRSMTQGIEQMQKKKETGAVKF